MRFTIAPVTVQTRVEPDIKIRAGDVLEKMGLTVSGAVRILLTRIAHDSALPAGLTVDTSAYEAWFKVKVHEALNDRAPRYRERRSKRIWPSIMPRFIKTC
ncbi:type II toxin-antitoxin system RelB/DinJ family antitoxin [Asticcacaulis excentricus]|uniref:type II toxin-antitoxin system RelB/DinJ family antitoxin n=1 Tax=Asticcacaulis excentricus TaxID=78587 RepID=UPI0001A76369|nr:type II toxin-antitoxin system RelB/DinJ family antitoxin [Asticcacaulis excentricus]